MPNKKLITEKDIRDLVIKGKNKLVVYGNEIFTPAAKDKINEAKIILVKGDRQSYNNKLTAQSLPVQNQKIISVGCDHTGFKVKEMIIEILTKQGHQVNDVGTYDENSCDYPDFALKVAEEIKNGNSCCGILIDATGIPSAISANKVPGIRAATCYNEFSAKSSREHNNSNVLVIGAKALGEESIKSILNTWLNSPFLGERHQRRLDKISEIEKKYSKS